jgi:predicted transcriptional regulator
MVNATGSQRTISRPAAEDTATAQERAAYAESIARGRAQYAAGETVSGEEVFKWLDSWGTENELPAPRPKKRQP